MKHNTLYFSSIRLSHQPLQPNSLVGGGLDSAMTTSPHPTLNSVQLPPEPVRQRQQQMRQQRLFQVRNLTALVARGISVQEGSVNVTVSGDGFTHLHMPLSLKAAKPGAINHRIIELLLEYNNILFTFGISKREFWTDVKFSTLIFQDCRMPLERVDLRMA